MSTPGFPYGSLSLVAFLVLLIALFIMIRSRRPRARLLAHFKPASAPPPCWTSRIVETSALAYISVLVFVLLVSRYRSVPLTNPVQSGFPLMNIGLIITIFFAAAILGALYLSLAWRTWAAALLLMLLLSAYGLGFNKGLIERIVPTERTSPSVKFSTYDEGNITDAEVRVNDVYLGKTPITTTLQEFHEKVPYWPEPPQGYSDRTDVVRIPRYGPTDTKERTYKRWMSFELPGYVYGHGWSSHGKVYYARVKLNEEWGGFSGYHGGSRSVDHSDEYELALEVVFPTRLKNMYALLDKARLADYQVGPEWFKAFQTYGAEGLRALRRALSTEPALVNVLDAWAIWRYGLEEATDPDSAWQAFKRICDEAEKLEYYSTSSVAGRAVEVLVPYLDPDHLNQRAVSLIHSIGIYEWSSWESNGRAQFGFTPNSGTISDEIAFVSGGRRYGSHSSKNSMRAPLSAYAVAHAIWKLDEHLDAEADSQINIVEADVVPELIRQAYYTKSIFLLQMASQLGGPDIERFLLRHNWRAGVSLGSRSFRENQMTVGMRDVNKWLYLLANLRGPEGRHFRTHHARELMDLADKMVEPPFTEGPLGFLFLDVEQGWQSLAARYWPRYLARTRTDRGSRTLKRQWQYLVSAEPASTLEMYLDSWHALDLDVPWSDPDWAITALEDLPPGKLKAVAEALILDIQQRGDEPLKPQVQYAMHRLTTLATQAVLSEADPVEMDRLLRDLREPGSHRRRNSIATLLEQTPPDHPLVHMLVQEEDPALRALALGHLRTYPTSTNRTILNNLVHDPDDNVRSRAEEAQRELEALASTPPHTFAAVTGRLPSETETR